MQAKLALGQWYDGALKLSAVERLGGKGPIKSALEDAGFENVSVFLEADELPSDFPDEIEAAAGSNAWARGQWGKTTTKTTLPPQVLAITEYDPDLPDPQKKNVWPMPPETWKYDLNNEDPGVMDLHPGEIFYVAISTPESNDEDEEIVLGYFKPFSKITVWNPDENLPDAFSAYNGFVSSAPANKFVAAEYTGPGQTVAIPTDKQGNGWQKATGTINGPIGINGEWPDGKAPTPGKKDGGGGGKKQPPDGGGGGKKQPPDGGGNAEVVEDKEDSGAALLGVVLTLAALGVLGWQYYRRKQRRRRRAALLLGAL